METKLTESLLVLELLTTYEVYSKYENELNNNDGRNKNLQEIKWRFQDDLNKWNYENENFRKYVYNELSIENAIAVKENRKDTIFTIIIALNIIVVAIIILKFLTQDGWNSDVISYFVMLFIPLGCITHCITYWILRLFGYNPEKALKPTIKLPAYENFDPKHHLKDFYKHPFYDKISLYCFSEDYKKQENFISTFNDFSFSENVLKQIRSELLPELFESCTIIPRYYLENKDAIKKMLFLFINKRADNIKDLINLYETTLWQESLLKAVNNVSISIDSLKISLDKNFAELGFKIENIGNIVKENTKQLNSLNNNMKKFNDNITNVTEKEVYELYNLNNKINYLITRVEDDDKE